MGTLEKKRVNVSIEVFSRLLRVAYKDGLIYGLNVGLEKNTKTNDEAEDEMVARVLNEIKSLLEY